MAAPTNKRREFARVGEMFQTCSQCLRPFVVIGIIFLFIQCISGHTMNDNLFMEILHPEEISYTYKIRPARTFGGVFDDMLKGVNLIPADPDDACGELYNAAEIYRSVALVKRGHCSFLSKAIEAEEAGAIAIVIYDHDETNDWSFIDMIGDGSERSTSIPAVFLLGRDGQNIKRSLANQRLQGAVINLPVNITGVPLGLVNIAPWSLW